MLNFYHCLSYLFVAFNEHCKQSCSVLLRLQSIKSVKEYVQQPFLGVLQMNKVYCLYIAKQIPFPWQFQEYKISENQMKIFFILILQPVTQHMDTECQSAIWLRFLKKWLVLVYSL